MGRRVGGWGLQRWVGQLSEVGRVAHKHIRECLGRGVGRCGFVGREWLLEGKWASGWTGAWVGGRVSQSHGVGEECVSDRVGRWVAG